MTNKSNDPKGITLFYPSRQKKIITGCYLVNPLLDPNYLKNPTLYLDNQTQKTGKYKIQARQYEALWDTGATCSAINLQIVENLKLIPVGAKLVSGVTGSYRANTYYLFLWSSDKVYHPLKSVPAIEMKDEVIIGMDVITKGDFAFCGGNLFSYYCPSFYDPEKFGTTIKGQINTKTNIELFDQRRKYDHIRIDT